MKRKADKLFGNTTKKIKTGTETFVEDIIQGIVNLIIREEMGVENEEVKKIEMDQKDRKCKKEANMKILKVGDSMEKLEDAAKKIRVQNKGLKSDLNLTKQYKKRVEFCRRKAFKIKEDKGSSDRKSIVIDLNPGMVEAIRLNLVNILEKDLFIPVVSCLK